MKASLLTSMHRWLCLLGTENTTSTSGFCPPTSLVDDRCHEHILQYFHLVGLKGALRHFFNIRKKSCRFVVEAAVNMRVKYYCTYAARNLQSRVKNSEKLLALTSAMLPCSVIIKCHHKAAGPPTLLADFVITRAFSATYNCLCWV